MGVGLTDTGSNWKQRISPSIFPGEVSKFWPENNCFVFSKKSLEFLFFLTLFSAGIYLLKEWLKHSQNWFFFLFLFSSGTWLFKLTETTSYFSKTSILTNKAPLTLIFLRGLHSTCKTYYNLSIKAETSN